MQRTSLFIKVYGVVVVFGLIMAVAGVETEAAIPPELELEIVTAPNFVSSPCPVNLQDQAISSNKPDGNGQIDHAAHHGSGGSSTIAPVSFTDATREDLIKQLSESSDYISNLLQLF